MKVIAEPLPREEVVRAIERRRPCRIPLVMAKWWGEGLVEQYGAQLDRFAAVPDDVAMLQDLITAAVNEAVRQAQDVAGRKMSAVTGGMGIPGLM